MSDLGASDRAAGIAGPGPEGSGPAWRVWVDTGGTFTDCLARDPVGRVHRAKVLSHGALRGVVASVGPAGSVRPERPWDLPDGFFAGATIRSLAGDDEAPLKGYRSRTGELELAAPLPSLVSGSTFEIAVAEEAPILAARMVTGTPLDRPLPPMALRLATTRGTNALLERRGTDTALFVTAGLGDLLEIGTQQRPDLFALRVVKPPTLVTAVVEVPGRLDADGGVVAPLDVETLRPAAEDLLARGIDTAAVALMHSYGNPVHELELEAWLLELGFRHVSRSSRLAPRIRILPRAETAVVNAYLSGVIEGYFDRVREALSGGSLHGLTSAGGLTGAERFEPKDSLLSGPAGGVVGASMAALRSGFTRALAFDMGGTSTDVSRFDGDYDYVFETRVGDARLMAPALAIETVAAGGGSVCWFDGRQLKVGPRSAGAQPGPAGYGCGGPLTLTDVNLLLGRLDPQGFEIPVRVDDAERALESLRREVEKAGGRKIGSIEVLHGLLAIANERMAEAVRRISIRRGYDPSEYALVAFGGAGGQHACALADILGIRAVVVPADAGLLSAHGLGHARVERFAVKQVLAPLAEAGRDLEATFADLAAEAAAAVAAEGVETNLVEIRRRSASLRLVGQEATLELEVPGPVSVGNLQEEFLAAYGSRYGYRPEDPALEVESLRVVASSKAEPLPTPVVGAEGHPAVPVAHRRAFVGGAWHEVPEYRRTDQGPGATLRGPALVFDRHSAALVEPDWDGRIDAHGNLVLERVARGRAGGTA